MQDEMKPPASAAIAGYVLLTMIMGYTWNILIFHSTYMAIGGSGRRPDPIIPLGMASMLLEGIALAVLFSWAYRGSNPIKEGLSLGLLAGAFSVGYAALVVPAKFDISPVWKYAALELAFGILHFGAAGLLFAFAFRRP